MRPRQSIGGWLSLVLCGVAAGSTALALTLHDDGLRADLSRVTSEHLLQAKVMTAHLLDQHLRDEMRRYRASAQTPELRANLELTHKSSLAYYAQRLATQHGALALAFLRSGKRVAAAGDSALSDAALARLEQLSSSTGVCSVARGLVCADAPEEGLAFALAYGGRLFGVTLVAVGPAERAQGRLLAVEEIGPTTLSAWSSLTLARVSVSPSDRPGHGLWELVRELGGGELQIEVSGNAERSVLGNARRNLLTSGAAALVLAFAASLLLARALVRPIQRIGEASRRIHSGDLAVRLRSRRSDELGEVARAFDAMLDRVQSAVEGLARAQHLAGLGSWTLDLASGAIECSRELRHICGLDPETRFDLPQLLERCVHPEDRPRMRDAVERCVRDGVPFRMDHRMQPRDGTTRVAYTHAERICMEGHPVRIEGTMQDVTERRLIEEQLRYLAEHDGLTGLANRRLLAEQLSVMLNEARLQPRGLAVLVMGLDAFQVINDTLGPSWGDRALEQVAQRLAQAATPHLSLARIGGDEFAVLAGGIRGPSDAARITRRMLRVLDEPLELNGHELVLGASAGIALWPNDGVDAESLLRNAGAALHVAKQHGRGSHQFYDESLNSLALKRLALERCLRRALENSEFELHYQPVLDLASGRVTSVEGLLRWCDPELGLVAPSEFIPVAEDLGLIREVGAWVLRTAVAQIQSWRGTPLAGLRVAINVSAAQLDGLELASHLEQVLADTGIEPSALMLEITESLLPSDPVAASMLLERIAALGIRIALDDFGIGFSSLSALRQLPIHTVKLDRSFASSLGTDPRSAQLIGAIVAMAQVLGLAVTVEGIETDDQLEIVREFGCDAIQGHLISAAVEPRDLPRVIMEIERDDDKRMPQDTIRREAP